MNVKFFNFLSLIFDSVFRFCFRFRFRDSVSVSVIPFPFPDSGFHVLVLPARRHLCYPVVLTAGFYSDSRAHNVGKVRVVKYLVVYGQIKAADQKYCHNQKWRRKLKEISFRTRGFEVYNLDDFWPRYCRIVFMNRINSKFFKRGKK